MTDLDEKLSNILKILSNLKNITQNRTEFKKINEELRVLNFEANEFFESLLPTFNLANDKLVKILDTIHSIILDLDSTDRTLFELKINLLNLQIFIPIHLLFALSSNDLSYQAKNQIYLENLVNKVDLLDESPEFDHVKTLEEKFQLDQYLRIYGSTGDLFNILCSNFSIIKQKNLIDWSNKCFKQFYLLDMLLDKFHPLNFYISNNLDVEDFYREIVGHYTILGNTNATNLLESIFSINNPQLVKKINFESYIEAPTISQLERKLEIKSEKIKELLEDVNQAKKNKVFFKPSDEPLNIISFKLMITLEKYFNFTLSKIRTYQKEFNQLKTPASNELKSCLSICEDWIENTLSLTEKNENILNTPFGGLFNSVFLEYLLLLALDDGKSIKENPNKKPLLEEKLEKYHTIFTSDDHALEQISDFIYYKTYAQIYVYCASGDLNLVEKLVDELFSLLQYLGGRPFLKLNSLCLLMYLERSIKQKQTNRYSLIKTQTQELINQEQYFSHLKHDLELYLVSLEKSVDYSSSEFQNLVKRMTPKVLDINSWLIPELESNSYVLYSKFISFNQSADKII